MISSSYSNGLKRRADLPGTISSPEFTEANATKPGNIEVKVHGSNFHGNTFSESNPALHSAKSYTEVNKTKSTIHATSKYFRLNALPLELQDMVFKYAMKDRDQIPLRWTGSNSATRALQPSLSSKAFQTMMALRATSRSIRAKILRNHEVYFVKNNQFTFGSIYSTEILWFLLKSPEAVLNDDTTLEFQIASSLFDEVRENFFSYHRMKMQSRIPNNRISDDYKKAFWFMTPWMEGTVQIKGIELYDWDRRKKSVRWICSAWAALQIWEYDKTQGFLYVEEFRDVFEDLAAMVKESGWEPPSKSE